MSYIHRHHEYCCTAPIEDVIYFCKKGQGRPGGRRQGRGGEGEEEIFKRMAEFRKLFSLEDEVVGDKEQEALEIFLACRAQWYSNIVDQTFMSR